MLLFAVVSEIKFSVKSFSLQISQQIILSSCFCLTLKHTPLFRMGVKQHSDKMATYLKLCAFPLWDTLKAFYPSCCCCCCWGKTSNSYEGFHNSILLSTSQSCYWEVWRLPVWLWTSSSCSSIPFGCAAGGKKTRSSPMPTVAAQLGVSLLQRLSVGEY